MNAEISALEQKVEELIALCRSLRAENRELRSRLAGAEGENRQLAEKVSAARSRLEALVARLPED